MATPAALPPAPLRAAVTAKMPGLSDAAWQPLAGGRVNRLWRVGAVVVKAYDAAGASPLFPNDPEAEARALALAAPPGLAPPLAAHGPGWNAYHYAAGTTWHEDPAQAARLLGRVHALAVPPGAFRTAPMGPDAVAPQARAIAAACRGTLPPMPDLPPIAAAIPAFIHGDAVAGNLIVKGSEAVLIDWQCPALGDAVDDLATFLSPAMQHLYRGTPLTPAEAEAFLAAYPDPATIARYRAMAPLLHWRIAAHCLWRAERGAPGYQAALALELGR